MARVTLALCPLVADSLGKGLRVIDHLRVVSFSRNVYLRSANVFNQYFLLKPRPWTHHGQTASTSCSARMDENLCSDCYDHDDVL